MADSGPGRADEGQLRGRNPGLFPLRQSGEGDQDAPISRGVKQLADSHLLDFPTFAAQSGCTMPFFGSAPDPYTSENGIRFHWHVVFGHLRRPRCRILGSFSRPDAVFGALVVARMSRLSPLPSGAEAAPQKSRPSHDWDEDLHHLRPDVGGLTIAGNPLPKEESPRLP